jgi:hypothetical protein
MKDLDRIFDPARFEAIDAASARIGLFGAQLAALGAVTQLEAAVALARVTLNSRDVTRGVSLKARIGRTLWLRMWVGAALVRLAAWVMGCKADVSVDMGSVG